MEPSPLRAPRCSGGRAAPSSTLFRWALLCVARPGDLEMAWVASPPHASAGGPATWSGCASAVPGRLLRAPSLGCNQSVLSCHHCSC